MWSHLILLCPTCFSSQLSVALLIILMCLFIGDKCLTLTKSTRSEICFILKSVRGKTLLDKRSCAHLWWFLLGGHVCCKDVKERSMDISNSETQSVFAFLSFSITLLQCSKLCRESEENFSFADLTFYNLDLT